MEKKKAWEMFKKTGKIEYYLEYKKKWSIMIKSVDGIVVSETNYGETSKIINILTKDGIIGIIAKGARSIKSPLRIYAQKFIYAKFHIYYKEGKLSILSSADIINNLENIKTDIILIGYMSYISDLINQTMKHNFDEKLYDLYIESILKINEGLNPKIICNILEIKVLDYLGVGINFDGCIKCKCPTNIVTINADAGGYLCKSCYKDELCYSDKTINMIRMYYLVEISSISNLKISQDVINDINQFITNYYERYTGLYLKSKQFLETVRT